MADEARRGEEDERGPGAAYNMFVVMEDLLDKLKLLDYEAEVLGKHNMKALSRHYFASSPYMPSNPGEQYYMFTVLASWLINQAGRPFEQPQEYDDPNATVSNILSELRAFGGQVDFPPSRLKTGSGEHVCYVLDRLAEEALKRKGFAWKKPKYPTEELEEESLVEDDAELTLSKVEEDMTEEPDDNEEENLIDLEALKARTSQNEANGSSKPDEILESNTDVAEWNLEVERVLPQLKVTVRADNKDWRIHVDQMHQHKDGIESSLKEAKGYLNKLQEDISKTLEKVTSREKYINKQLEHLVQDYRSAHAKLSQSRERYQQGSGGVTERTRVLSEISEDLEKVKQEMEERGSSMSDGAPLVKIKQSLTKLKQEVIQMDIRIGVVEHTILQAQLKEKSNMTRDMHATSIPEPAIGTY
ncbi:intraflagellar transport protein 57 homolog isoform X4 [Brienomyrus brachyistius]|uniref:intraflagellar transport protein 57 homolog isoform X1 n=1 Tax=Brienomyrus brachyistius TaxID=42636 RepID=UPI0020B213E1|nr:intraflagellar transport protein 57 homolog isoform X1 [Brienomyrus brachyistius]XP_048868323.1 intraflagellar transport protein 57 homolog isoform X2 [Brienomyrus brachyistius]XP_048868325.1 intraflagellar transport protein 57 homolog isoform X3 [Brienomyrus brachyistius]XP_048868326.1 intraflagellar transport protein 57 homolog isoform X4 [Brienomyrus brachyistius]XP_048868327.1 intraflagellar transport protein 57 homolog isoform X5 [Brienomyrus brachyistius]XP_048868328.1 intraflagellar 